MSESITFGVIGNGSWATALIKILAENKNIQINWWMRDQTTVEYIAEFHHNPKYLSSVEIHPDVIKPTSNIQDVIDNSDILLMCVPSAFVHQALSGAVIPQNKIIITAIKGIEPHTKMVIAKYLQNSYGVPLENIALISGPCHAEEVALEKLSYLTISSLREENTKLLASYFDCRFINITQTSDIIGAEYASVLKNIYAIGSGIAHGLGYGDNFQAVYVAAAIREMEKFLHEIHVDERDVKEAAYLGDLLVTCYSQFSRNRSFGTMLGKGYSVKSAQLEMNMVAEGYYATELVYELATNSGISMPIVQSVYQVVYKQGNAAKLFKQLAEKQLY